MFTAGYNFGHNILMGMKLSAVQVQILFLSPVL